MRGYIIGRLLLAIPTLFFLVTLAFLASHAMPDYAVRRVSASYTGAENHDAAVKAARHDLGLDKPLWKQYLIYLRNVSHLDLGRSFLTGQPVLHELKNRVPPSFELGVLELLVALALALPIGVISALRQDTWLDYVLRLFSIIWLAVPSFFLAVLFLIVSFKLLGWTPPLTTNAYHNLLPGLPRPPALPAGAPTVDPIANLKMMAIPAIAGGAATGATIMRLLRSQMLEVLRQDYVRTAWAKGLRERTIVVRHALKNAMIPVVTLIGLVVSALFTGNLIMESIFQIPGMGLYSLTSLKQNDFPATQGIVLIVAIALVFSNLLVDLTYAWLDPRIRYQ